MAALPASAIDNKDTVRAILYQDVNYEGKRLADNRL